MRSMPVAILLVLSVAIFPACRKDTVELDYTYREGTTLTYLLDADARASWNIVEPGSGSYSVRFEVEESIVEVDNTGATVAVTMTPLSVEENSLPAPGAEERSFDLRIGPDGEVLEVLAVNGVSAAELDPDELSFIGTYRPPLPLQPVRLRDEWESEQQVDLAGVFQKTTTLGSLRSLGIDDRGPHAELSYTGGGPLEWNLALPVGDARLTGTARSTGAATVGIADGLLRTSHSQTRGNFAVEVDRPDAEPVSGALYLELDLDLELIDAS